MHMDAAKSFSTAEANENERRWNEERFDQKNQDPTNHYDKTRQHLNFEIGPDGKIHPLGYQEKSLEVRLAERLEQLGWHSFMVTTTIILIWECLRPMGWHPIKYEVALFLGGD